MNIRICEHLSACPPRSPGCAGCKPFAQAFAPGVIDVACRPRPRWRRWAWRAVAALCVATVMLGLWDMAHDRGNAMPGACASAKGA